MALLKNENKIKLNLSFSPWQIVSFILFLVLLASIFTNGFSLKQALSGPSDEKLIQAALGFVNEYLVSSDSPASLVGNDCKEKVNVCRFALKVNGKDYDSFISSDEKLFFTSAIEIEKFKQEQKNNQASSQQPVEVPKTAKPDVKLFVMSYCPYGLQAQKALLPVMDLLKDKADIKIHFVNYIMHEKKEIDENLRQYCIQKQEPGKYSAYLKCFAEAGEYEKCLTQVKINKTKMNNCVSQVDKDYKVSAGYEDKSTWLNGQFPKFTVEDDLNKQYNVQGSPTMVINGQVVSPTRTPEGYKNEICNAFDTLPTECAQTLSTQALQPGFGFEAGQAASGECQ